MRGWQYIGQRPKDGRRLVQDRDKARVSSDTYFFRGPGNKLNNARGNTSFCEYLVGDVIRVYRHRRGFPDNSISNERRCTAQVATDCSEVERRHGKDETLQSAVLYAAEAKYTFNFGRGRSVFKILTSMTLRCSWEAVVNRVPQRT
jgi:hypothetical protein